MRCTECGSIAGAEAIGWRAYIADDPLDDEPAMVAVYCPACALREFGPRGARQEPEPRRHL